MKYTSCKTCETFTATIYVGLKPMYHGNPHPPEKCEEIVQDYVDRVGLGVTFTQTKFLYTKGNEPGIIIGLINYPRFPSSPEEIKEHALEIAERCLKELIQYRISIVCSDGETIMLEDEENDDEE